MKHWTAITVVGVNILVLWLLLILSLHRQEVTNQQQVVGYLTGIFVTLGALLYCVAQWYGSHDTWHRNKAKDYADRGERGGEQHEAHQQDAEKARRFSIAACVCGGIALVLGWFLFRLFF